MMTFLKVFFFFSCVKLIGSAQKNLYNPDHFYPIFRSKRIESFRFYEFLLFKANKKVADSI